MFRKLSVAAFALAVAWAPGVASAGIITFIDNQLGWETQIGGAGSVTGTEDFNSFASDVSGHNTTLNLPLFSITSTSSNSSFNLIDAPPHFTTQSNQNGTTSYLGLQSVILDFVDDLTALAFDYVDSGSTALQNYTLQVNFAGGGNASFLLGNPDVAEFRGIVADGGMLIDSVAWIAPASPSPFSIDNIRVVASSSSGPTPMPLPSTMILFLTGLVGVSYVARRVRAVAPRSASI